MPWQLVLLGTGLFLFFANLVVHVVYAYAALQRFENRPTFSVLPPPQVAPLPEPMEIETRDGLRLRGGAYYPADGHPRGIILFCPETDGSYLTAMNYAAALVESGFAVVSFSFRNQQPSDFQPDYRATHWFTQHEVDDIHAILDFLQSTSQLEGLPIGLMGVSRGGGAALAAGATRPEVRGVWAQGAFSTHRLVLHYSLRWVHTVVGSAARFIPKWHVRVTSAIMLKMSQWRNGGHFVRLEPLLPRWRSRDVKCVSGARDTYIPTHLTQQLCQMTGHSIDECHWVVPHAKHNLERNAAPLEFDHRLVEFFEHALVDAPHVESPVPVPSHTA